MPAGVPRYVRCYESAPDGPASWDRFTVIFTGRAAPESCGMHGPKEWPCVGLSGHGGTKNQPADTIRHDKAGGVGGYSWPPAMGRSCHPGKRVPFSAMPEQLRAVALEDYREIWRLNAEGEA